jgi:hypothetical protein
LLYRLVNERVQTNLVSHVRRMVTLIVAVWSKQLESLDKLAVSKQTAFASLTNTSNVVS